MTDATFRNVTVSRPTATTVQDLLMLDSVDTSAGNGAALSFVNNSATPGLYLALGRVSASRVDPTTVRLDLAVASDPTVSSGDDTPPLLSLVSGAGGQSVTTPAASTVALGGPLTVGGNATVSGNAVVSGTLQASGATTLTGGLRVSGNLDVTGTVDGRDVSGDGGKLDQHLANKANPHTTTAAQVGALPIAGGTLSGSLTVNGNVGIGATNPGFKFEVHGANMLTDVNAAFNSHFPWTDNNAYVTGQTVHLRGGAPQGWKTTLLVDSASGHVGIGTESPLVTLEVRGVSMLTDVNAAFNSHFPWSDNNAYVTGQTIHLRGGAPQGWKIALTVNSASGNVGIGTTNPGFKLDVGGVVRAQAFVPPSDARLKTKITPLTDTLAKLAQMRGVVFEWNERFAVTDRSQRGRQIGVIAQEVEAVFPELVVTAENDGLKAVDYNRLAAILIEAVKELNHKIEMLEQCVMHG